MTKFLRRLEWREWTKKRRGKRKILPERQRTWQGWTRRTRTSGLRILKRHGVAEETPVAEGAPVAEETLVEE